MTYRGWTISAYETFLGYSAQYISPMGHPSQAGGYFPTDQQAIAYAQALVDHRLRHERLGLREGSPAGL